jgi:glycosyltransferase involved in cell wall biosynthesis
MKTKKENISPKRHCMVVHAYYPLGETRVERQAAALIGQGFEVDIICLRGEDEEAVSVEKGANVYRLPMQRHKGHGSIVQLLEYLAFFVLASWRLLTLHLRRKYGVVQVHNLPDFLVFAALVPKLTGAYAILDIHDLMPEFFASKTESQMQSLLVRLLILQEQLSCRFADQVITVTSEWRETLIRRGVPARKVAVVMNVADAQIFHPIAPEQLPLSSHDKFKLIYHGTITKRYGVDLMLQAVRQAREQVPNIQLTVHGSGEFLEESVCFAHDLNMTDIVHFSTQFLPTSDLPELIRGAEVGIVPNQSNIFTDGILPTKLMEYVALGIPVIAARTPAIKAYFDDTMVQFFEPGNVDDLANCIVSLGHDRQRLNQLAHNADRFNEQYNWDKVADEYVELVNGLNGR